MRLQAAVPRNVRVAREGPSYLVRLTRPGELAAVQRLRAEVYVEQGFLHPDQLVGGLDLDGQDHRAVNLGAFEIGSGDLVGSFRLIFRDGTLLPIEEQYGLQLDAKTPIELSRLAVARPHRATALSIGLWKAAFDVAADAEVDYAFAIIENPLFSMLNRLGLPFVKIGEPLVIYNTLNWPARCRAADLLPSMMSVRPDLAELFERRGQSRLYQSVLIETAG